jgi:deoxyadenosine/deoxycytidine kinase
MIRLPMYILEGNIGAGKSTFLQLIKKYMKDIDVALEPLHNWQKKVYGQSLLTNFYQDAKRWAYSLETFAMICRVKEHIKDQAQENQNRIIERSIYSGHYCFAVNGYKHGFMSDSEWELYQQWFNFLIPNKCLPPRGFIYLQTNPEVAYKRLKKRNRLAEKKISFAYLQQIHDHHEQFLIDKTGIIPALKNIPVLVLDCNEEFETNPQMLQNHFYKITQFMNEHSTYNMAFQNKVINAPTLI